ncbi:hypothetical protein [Marinobacterium rhizophilum]|uniref:Uncharacterized protein n=1 Tax=Marinobacterium rhizophilum TaxID=420402 RepID=A0ABY5HGV8_9GAMM|nr:hypothetical protein [Marinobacterium rhizophilum]UTW11530.1 hypothetical protein KDW95_20110 [Marinobacterium rhizophilum]
MKILYIVFIAVVVFLNQAYASCGDYPIIKGKRSDGRVVSVYIKDDYIMGTDSWGGEYGKDIALSQSEVLGIFYDWVSKSDQFNSVKVFSISLNRHGCSELKDKWYYTISYNPLVNGLELQDVGFWLIILLDGRVVEPVVE